MCAKKKIVIFSGAGMSAESGIGTFRDSGGLWEKYKIEAVATPEAWQKNHELVLDFYNQRRKQILEAKPNEAHKMIAQLETDFDVEVITQNIDDLHERAGSTKVTHLHGEIRKSQSTQNSNLVYDIEGWELKLGDKCELGSQLRPHVVWFGEMVPMISVAEEIIKIADILVVVGTSLQVYPAAGLVHCAKPEAQKFIIDPTNVEALGYTQLKKPATAGFQEILERRLFD